MGSDDTCTTCGAQSGDCDCSVGDKDDDDDDMMDDDDMAGDAADESEDM